jgi:hypothetical protein
MGRFNDINNIKLVRFMGITVLIQYTNFMDNRS